MEQHTRVNIFNFTSSSYPTPHLPPQLPPQLQQILHLHPFPLRLRHLKRQHRILDLLVQHALIPGVGVGVGVEDAVVGRAAKDVVDG